MARSDKKYYIKIRERFVKCILDLLNSGVAETQTTLALTLGVHASQLNRLVRAVRLKEDVSESPTLDMIVELSNQFGYSCEWIMTGRGVMKLKESEKEKLKRLEKQINDIEMILSTKDIDKIK